MNIPKCIEDKAFRTLHEYAWQKQDLKQLFGFCLEAQIAILGGEAWVVIKIPTSQPDEPSGQRHNIGTRFDHDRVVLAVLARTSDHVVYGIFPFKDGSSGLFSWDTKKVGRTWHDYVEATVQGSESVINKGNLEQQVIPEYSQQIFYNFVFEEEPKA
jgi:hypothetical protein